MRHSTWSCAWLYLSVCYWLVGLVTFPGAQDDDNLWHGDRSHALGKASSYCYRVTSSEVSDKAPRVSGDVSGHSQQIPWTQDCGVAQKMRSRSRKHFYSPLPLILSPWHYKGWWDICPPNWCHLLCPASQLPPSCRDWWVAWCWRWVAGRGRRCSPSPSGPIGCWAGWASSPSTSDLCTQALSSRSGPKQPHRAHSRAVSFSWQGSGHIPVTDSSQITDFSSIKTFPRTCL